MTYEIEHIFLGRNRSMTNLYCTLTGLEPEEVEPLIKQRMGGQMFISIFRELGYNTNDRFIKFDRNTPYPIVLRCCNHEKGVWFPFVYHQGIIFDVCYNRFINIDDKNQVRCMNGKYFLIDYGMRVTSMLQVWI